MPGRTPGSANCVAIFDHSQGRHRVLRRECYQTMTMNHMQQSMPWNGMAMDAGYRVGRTLGNVFGTVMGGAAALGVGATVGIAETVTDASACAFPRSPTFQAPALPVMNVPTNETETFESPRSYRPPLSLPNGPSGASSSQSMQRPAFLPKETPTSATPAAQESAEGACASGEATVDVKEEPTSEEASKEGLPEVDTPDDSVCVMDAECQATLKVHPSLRPFVEMLMERVNLAEGDTVRLRRERNQWRRKYEELDLGMRDYRRQVEERFQEQREREAAREEAQSREVPSDPWLESAMARASAYVLFNSRKH